MVPLNPKITNAGLALFPNPTGAGLKVTLTHIAIGTSRYDPVGTETALKAEVARFPIIAGGIPTNIPNQVQIGANITDKDPSGRSANDQWIGEIGFYAGATLFAVWSRPNKALFYKTTDFDIPVAYRLDVSRLPANSVTVSVDVGVVGMQSLIFQHEDRLDPHPQYLTKERGDALFLTPDEGHFLFLTPEEGNAAYEARFPKGTRLLFQQSAAPVGWTKVTDFDNAALRVVSGNVGSGGTMDFTSAFASRTPSGSVSTDGSVSTTGTVTTTGTVNTTGSVSSTTLSESQMPSHNHDNGQHDRLLRAPYVGSLTGDDDVGSGAEQAVGTGDSGSIASAGGGGSHSHGLAVGSTFTGASTFTGTSSFSGWSSFSGTAMNFAVKYTDVIIASKD